MNVGRVDCRTPPVIGEVRQRGGWHWQVYCQGGCGGTLLVGRVTHEPVDPADPAGDAVRVVWTDPPARTCRFCTGSPIEAT